MKRLLHLPDDPRAVDVLEAHDDIAKIARAYVRGNSDPLRSLVEELAVRGIVPDDWTHDERIESLAIDRDALIILRNPRALLTAERLLLDALDAAHAESVRRHGEDASRGRYIGVRSWEALCGQAYAGDRGSYLPSAGATGHRSADVHELDQSWIDETRATGDSYGSPGAHAWRMADQILGGPPWVTALYETGLGLWCWRDDYGAPEWALIVRPGDGMPWPRLARESAA